jgi:hypothetical protein
MFMLSLNLKIITKYWLLLLVLMVLVGGVNEVKGQTRTYANTQRSGITSNIVLGATVATGTVTNAPFSVDNDYTNSTGLATTSTLGVGTAWVQLIFPGNIAANSTSFVKINNSAGALLGGEITVKAYINSSTSSDGTTVGITTPISTIIAPDGSTFLVVTPNANYNSISITLSYPVALGSNSASVFYAFNEPPGTSCSLALATSVSVTGIALGGAVTSPNNAIDNDLSTYSTLSVGLLGVAASIKQMVYFSSQSNLGDAATVTFSVPPGLLTLGLFDGITLTAYNGPTQVGTPIAFSSLLSLDLLFLGGGSRYTGSFVPSGVFDRIEISTSSVASVLGSLYLHEVQRTPPKPAFSTPALQNPTICASSSVTLSPIAPASGNELRWYSSLTATTPLATANTYTPSPSLTATTTYYVATAKTGCTAESERVPATVTVTPLPTASISGSTSVCQSATSPNITFTGANGTAPYTFTYNINGGSNTTITTTTGNTVTLSVPTATAGTFNYNLVSVKESSATQCSNSQTGTATVVINPKPLHPITSISSN